MRTKTLLLIAAICAASAATSMAQVFSVNAVGYVNKTIPKKGFAMVSNPLKAATNTINALFQPVPDGFTVYLYNTDTKAYDICTYDALEGAFIPANVASKTLLPGQGAFVKNPSDTDLTITFVGEVPQGNLSTPLVKGYQIVSSQVPQAGTATALGLAGKPGDTLYQYIINDPVAANNQKYYISSFDDLENKWVPDLKPLDVGEAFFLNSTAAGTWTRDFSVNQ